MDSHDTPERVQITYPVLPSLLRAGKWKICRATFTRCSDKGHTRTEVSYSDLANTSHWHHISYFCICCQVTASARKRWSLIDAGFYTNRNDKAILWKGLFKAQIAELKQVTEKFLKDTEKPAKKKLLGSILKLCDFRCSSGSAYHYSALEGLRDDLLFFSVFLRNYVFYHFSKNNTHEKNTTQFHLVFLPSHPPQRTLNSRLTLI